MINKFDIYLESLDSEKRLNWIIDKMSKFGKHSLTPTEKEFLDTYQEDKPIKIPESEHYNKYIIALLNDVKNNRIDEKIAKSFIEKHISKDDLSEFLLSLLKDGKLNFLTDIYNITEKQKSDIFKPKENLIIPDNKSKRKIRKPRYIKIPNFIKY